MKTKKRLAMKKEIQFQQVIGFGCGSDVHKDTIVAKIRSSSSDYKKMNSAPLQFFYRFKRLVNV